MATHSRKAVGSSVRRVASRPGLRRRRDPGRRVPADRVPVLVWTTDPDFRVSWGLKPACFAGLAARIGELLGSGDPAVVVVAAHRRALKGEAAGFELAWEGRTIQARVEPLRSGRTVSGVAGAALDVSAVKRVEDQLLRAAGRDVLTKLPNRSQFLERLRQATAPVGWSRDGLFLLLLDLDRFKDLNERRGYAAGDRLLVEVAGRLKGRLRPDDVLARFGADEFAVLLGGVKSGEEAVRVAERLTAELAPPFPLDGHEITASVSVGIAVGTGAGQRPEHILRDADRALSRAKAFGPGGCQMLAPGLDPRERRLLQVETALHRALDREEFREVYQPVVSRKGGNVDGFEVLLWKRSGGPGGGRREPPQEEPARRTA